jgi:hypothetical protein
VLARETNMGLEEELAHIVAALTANMDEGRFFPFPKSGGETCRQCDFRPVCGPGMESLARLKQSDPRARFLLEMRGEEP